MAQTQQTPTDLTVTRRINAPAAAIFDLLATPARHADFDGSGLAVAGDPNDRVTGVGDVFTLDMHSDSYGDYRMANTVVAFEPDRVIGWSPGLPGQEPNGHTFTYTLDATSEDTTEVALTYDWAEFKLDWIDRMPIIPREALEQSLHLLEQTAR